MGVLAFDYSAFIAAYPTFQNCMSGQLSNCFDQAGLYCDNSASNPAYAVGSPAPPGILPLLLNLLTAHIAWLTLPRDPLGNPSSSGQPPPATVGRVASAGEGSVNVSLDMPMDGTPGQAWFMQTQWGASYWAATAQFRLGRYAARPTVVAGPTFPYLPARRLGWPY